jgi:hypothetical protein
MQPWTPASPEPRWPALMAIFAVGGLQLALPAPYKTGPDWLLMTVIVLLAVPLVVTHRTGLHRWNQILAYILLSVVTAALVGSVCLLIIRLPEKKESPTDLLRAAAALWGSNVLIFASWYWRLDAGGPHGRSLRAFHTTGAFLFPQMTLDPHLRAERGETHWRPGFVDYLFLAFNSSTAFSPTDVPVLSRWAKGLMMLQASLSLLTLALLAARAVNIL